MPDPDLPPRCSGAAARPVEEELAAAGLGAQVAWCVSRSPLVSRHAPSSFETIRTVGAPAPNDVGHVFPQAEQVEIVGEHAWRLLVDREDAERLELGAG